MAGLRLVLRELQGGVRELLPDPDWRVEHYHASLARFPLKALARDASYHPRTGKNVAGEAKKNA